MQKKERFPVYIALVVFLLSLLFFAPAREAGMVHDFTGFFLNSEDATWLEALGSYDYNVVQPFLQSFNLGLFRIAGRSAILYYLIFHMIFGLGVYAWLRFIWEYTESKVLVVALGLSILVNPCIAEVLIYDVSQAYLWTFLFLGIYHCCLLAYIENGKALPAAGLVISLLFQLWTFDYILVYLPLTILFLTAFTKVGFQRRYILPIGLSALACLAYFLQNKFFLATYVGHYGEDIHLRFSFLDQCSTLIKQVLKLLGQCQFYSYPLRHSIYELASSIWVQILFCVGCTASLAYLAFVKKKSSLAVLFNYQLLLGVILLLPVSNLYFSDLLLTENDRYGFLPGIFLVTSISTLIWMLIPAKFRWPCLLLLALGLFLGQSRLVRTWATGQSIVSEVLTHMPEDFFDPDQRIFLLNLPDNFEGVYLFKNLTKESKLLEETFVSQRGDTTFADLSVVAQMNMVDELDGARAIYVAPDRLEVELEQYGTWWWRNGLGAYNYGNEKYDFELSQLAYSLSLKDPTLRYFVWQDGQFLEVRAED